MKYNATEIILTLAIVLTSCLLSSQALAATEVLGGTATTGNLRVSAFDNGRVAIARYSGSSWQSQIYFDEIDPSKGSYVRVGSNDCGLGNYFWGAAHSGTAVSNVLSGNKITTIVNCPDAGVQFKQELTYVDGQEYMTFRWTITNTSGGTLNDLRFYHGEDTYLSGGDNGAGFWDAANKTVGVQKTIGEEQQRMSLQGVDTPAHYQSEDYGAPSTAASTSPYHLTDAINSNEATDNGYAMEWNSSSLADGEGPGLSEPTKNSAWSQQVDYQ
jgi:hypothetical protein